MSCQPSLFKTSIKIMCLSFWSLRNCSLMGNSPSGCVMSWHYSWTLSFAGAVCKYWMGFVTKASLPESVSLCLTVRSFLHPLIICVIHNSFRTFFQNKFKKKNQLLIVFNPIVHGDVIQLYYLLLLLLFCFFFQFTNSSGIIIQLHPSFVSSWNILILLLIRLHEATTLMFLLTTKC